MNGRRFHLLLTMFWAVLAIPTMMWWRQSIAWVSFMSIYAIIVGHWSSYQAARAEEAASGKGDVEPTEIG